METTATVLLVDDDPGIVDMAATFVERANGALATTTATDPAAALERMDELIEECLTFARHGQVVTDPERVALADVAERAWETVGTGTAELVLDDLGVVEADGERLRTIFENVFRNAIEHGDATTVRVGSLDAGGFYVADDGPGIPDDERERVFERGYSTDEGGTGLGLPIVTTLAEAHGWATAIADAGSGTRFEVAFEPTVPLAAE